MHFLGDLINDAIAKHLAEKLVGLSDDEAEALIDEAIVSIMDTVETETLASVHKLAPGNRRYNQRTTSRFVRHLKKRWKPVFERLEVIWAISEELGRLYNERYRSTAAEQNDYKFDALIHLHARALLIVREMICLLEGGYPDGALARWRSLHEHAVVATFIRQSDADTAYRYLASFYFTSLSRARNYNDYADRANLRSFTDDELKEMEAWCDALKSTTGNLKGDFGWAAATLGKKSPTLLDLEKATGLDHWRPRYKWACQHNHAPHRPGDKLLGAAEAEQIVFLVGGSNSGFVDPVQMAAMSLEIITTTLMLHEEVLDNIIWLRVLHSFVDGIGEFSMSVEAETKTIWDEQQQGWWIAFLGWGRRLVRRVLSGLGSLVGNR
ncbi:DUF5677 domain-containing protein [Maricaulis sp.]|uniref:DUF5677 domain-containing protein n=1 Tax=Maricaulis sp. TaxID=1486257 RepID=UPI00260399B8|nr:DUF5677 domain-containing protein [Maricaulis sp.]